MVNLLARVKNSRSFFGPIRHLQFGESYPLSSTASRTHIAHTSPYTCTYQRSHYWSYQKAEKGWFYFKWGWQTQSQPSVFWVPYRTDCRHRELILQLKGHKYIHFTIRPLLALWTWGIIVIVFLQPSICTLSVDFCCYPKQLANAEVFGTGSIDIFIFAFVPLETTQPDIDRRSKEKKYGLAKTAHKKRGVMTKNSYIERMGLH